MTRFCARCGNQLPPQARFCVRCGAPAPTAPGAGQEPLSPSLQGSLSATTPPGRRRNALPLLGLGLGLIGLLTAGSLLLHSGAAPTHLPQPTATVSSALPAPTASAAPTPLGSAAPTPTPGQNDATPTPGSSGNGPPHVVALVDSLTFSDQDPGTTSDPQTVTLSNEGGSDQPLGPVTIGGANPDAFAASGDCANNLASVSRCNEEVTFTPPSAGDYSATLEFVDPQGNIIASVDLSGHGGTSTPDVAIDPAQLDFGSVNVGDSSSNFVTLTNNGTAAIGAVSADLSLDDGSYALSNNCSGGIDAGTNCTVDVTFTPPDNSAHNTTLTLSDDQGNTLGSVAIFGQGYDPSSNHLRHRRALKP